MQGKYFVGQQYAGIYSLNLRVVSPEKTNDNVSNYSLLIQRSPDLSMNAPLSCKSVIFEVGVLTSVLVATLLGIFGPIAQLFGVFVVLLFGTWLLGTYLGSGRRFPTKGSRQPIDVATSCDVDNKTKQFEADLESLQHRETLYAEQYALRRCSAEDVLRVSSLRLQAEITLLRHQKMPKTWAEVCQQRDA